MPPKRKPAATDKRRAGHRLAVSLPLLVRGRDVHGGAFEDTSHSFDVSREGASFVTRRELRVGQYVELIFPQRPPGRVASQRPEFETTAEVRRMRASAPGEWEVGVQFVGPRFRTYIPESA
jgi:hypothetical protein